MSPGRRRSRPQVEALDPRALPSTNPVWVVAGDREPANTDDTIVIRRNPTDASVLQAVVNGVVVDSRPRAGVAELHVLAGSGDDTVSVELGNRTSALAVRVWGGAGADRITGTNGRDELRGGRGDDTIDGAGGDDWLGGARDNDRLRGGLGSDRLDGGAGDNTFYGNDAADRVVRAGDHATYRQENANPLNPVTSADELRDWVTDRVTADWGSRFGETAYTGGGVGGGGGINPAPLGGNDDATTNTSYTGTNTQEAGVDEADILKTDGEYLFTVGGDELLVIDARTPEQLAIVGRVTLPDAEHGTVGAFYLIGDRVVVLSQRYEYDGPGPIPIDDVMTLRAAFWWPSRSYTVVTTIDVADRTAPAVAHETTLDGWLVDSRAVDGRVYAVVGNNLRLPQPLLIEGDTGTVYESEADYRTRLEDNFPDVLPEYTTTDYDADGTVTGTGSLVEDAAVFLPETAAGEQFLSIAVFDPAADTPGPASVTTVAGTTGEVYASTDSLYVAATDYSSPWRDGGESTQVYKFALAGSVPLEAVGSVAGTVLNQFSMDEEAGYFRIATTSGWGDSATNAVYVMAETGETLDVVGAAENIGATERIYSVRFEGDLGYVVTFRQTDPLFVLDMSDPTAPTVLGELHIPGYSSYLQWLGDGLLFGLGRDADDEGRVRGLQVSLFDVSDPTDPRRIDVRTFSTESWGGWSAAEWDHHAISWFPDDDVLALPVASGDYDDPAVLELLRLTPDGIEPLGEIAHGSPVLRSLGIGGVLFSLSAGEIQAHALADPSVALGAVALPTPPEPPNDGFVWAL